MNNTFMTQDDKDVIKEGIVFKKGEGFMSGWKERYLILYTGQRLSYFVIDGLELKGSIYINNLSSSNITSSNKCNKSEGANFGFSIQTTKRKWEFAIKSSKEREEWIKKIRLTVANQKRHSNLYAKKVNKASDDQSIQLIRSNTSNSMGVDFARVQTRSSSKSAIAAPMHPYYQQYAAQSQQYSNNYKQAQQQNGQGYNNHYNYAQYNHYQQQQQQAQQLQQAQLHRNSSFTQNGYNNYQQQAIAAAATATSWNANTNHQQNKANKPYKSSLKSVYKGFKIKRYDNTTRFSHLLRGYIRKCMEEENKFGLKLQNLCQQYTGFLLTGNVSPLSNSRLFQNNEKMATAMVTLLCDGMNKYFLNDIELLYRGSRDGLKAKAFHSKCDGHPKTLVLLYTNFGNICGGFTDVAWSTDNKYHADKNAFLFVLNSDGDGGEIFHLKQGEDRNAVLHYKDYGPTFGKGHDLAVFSLSDNNMDTQACNYSFSFISNKFIGGWMYCKVMECEVFQIHTL